MNKKARDLGLRNTHFVNPNGMPAEGHYTTARELAKIAIYAMSNDTFRDIVSSKTRRLEYGNMTISNSNRLLSSYEGTIGVKTGFTKAAGRCLVSAAEKDGGNGRRKADTRRLRALREAVRLFVGLHHDVRHGFSDNVSFDILFLLGPIIQKKESSARRQRFAEFIIIAVLILSAKRAYPLTNSFSDRKSRDIHSFCRKRDCRSSFRKV